MWEQLKKEDNKKKTGKETFSIRLLFIKELLCFPNVSMTDWWIEINLKIPFSG